jgi:GNAT superfamily N-acetyltransferase
MRTALLTPGEFVTAADGLAEVLLDCIEDGASVGFVLPVRHEELRDWWRGSLTTSGTLTWVTRQMDGRIVACVQLKPVGMPNGTHRAEVSKLLVHRDARGQGVAAELMRTLEAEALRQGRTLLMLDTQSGSPAEGIYLRWGWTAWGQVADYAAWPDGSLGATTFLWKRL